MSPRNWNLPAWFLVTVWGLWVIDLVLIVIGSVMMPLQHHAPWESSGMSHFIAYMGLGFLPMLLRPGWRWALVLFVGGSAFGALMEWIQTFVPGRHGTVDDALVNSAGLAGGIVIGYWMAKGISPILRRMAVQDRTVS